MDWYETLYMFPGGAITAAYSRGLAKANRLESTLKERGAIILRAQIVDARSVRAAKHAQANAAK